MFGHLQVKVSLGPLWYDPHPRRGDDSAGSVVEDSGQMAQHRLLSWPPARQPGVRVGRRAVGHFAPAGFQ